MAEVEETLKRIQAHKGVIGTIVVNAEAGSRGQQSKQGCPDLPLPRHFLQLFRRDLEAFPGQPRDIVSPACPGSFLGPLPGGACPEHLSRETSRRHPKQMPEPPQLPPFDVEEQRLYSELLPGDRAPYPISKGAPHHPTEEAHFGRLYPGSYPFGHDPELMTIGIPIRTTLDNSTTVQYAGLLHQLAMKARSTVRDIDPQNDLTFLRIRSKKHEIMVAPDKDYLLIVIQNPSE
ncbi:hypothetical protein QTP70_016128 [Hemibagrus guttatus]|uniref:Roadblock/LAMTOR2 domain-containing protein n=1 Tax=Hemibagrus guttatus TaxID=175788 RepID=A0AAE0QMX0_9TELE|nr:hypothetical protein QTP70_016128 [Hemibagrus guttatus]KAK3558305.1 hypothetical protein QTP86_014702 [Hemibagrus guttatus]